MWLISRWYMQNVFTLISNINRIKNGRLFFNVFWDNFQCDGPNSPDELASCPEGWQSLFNQGNSERSVWEVRPLIFPTT